MEQSGLPVIGTATLPCSALRATTITYYAMTYDALVMFQNFYAEGLFMFMS